MKTMFKGLLLAGVATAGVATAAWAVQSQHGINAASLDADGDGVISMAELDAHAAQLFAHMDSNRDGVLAGDEMHALHGAMQLAGVAMPEGHRPPESVDQAAFRSGLRSHAVQLDANKDGRLTMAELGAALHGGRAH